jgi:hypothetical protein
VRNAGRNAVAQQSVIFGQTTIYPSIHRFFIGDTPDAQQPVTFDVSLTNRAVKFIDSPSLRLGPKLMPKLKNS